MKTSNLSIRIEPNLKNEAEEVLSNLGLSLSGAVNLFFKQIILNNGLPFEVKMPTKKPMEYELLTDKELEETLDTAIKEVEEGKGVEINEAFRNIKKKIKSK